MYPKVKAYSHKSIKVCSVNLQNQASSSKFLTKFSKNVNCLYWKSIRLWINHSQSINSFTMCLVRGRICKMDSWRLQKISKHYFKKDIEKFFHEITQIGLEALQFVLFWNISTNTLQSSGHNGPWLACWLSIWPKVFSQISIDRWWASSENLKNTSWFIFEF